MNYEIKSAKEAKALEIFSNKNTGKLSYKNSKGIIISIDSAEDLIAIQSDLTALEAIVNALPTAPTTITVASSFEVENLQDQVVPNISFTLETNQRYKLTILAVYGSSSNSGDCLLKVSANSNIYGTGWLTGFNASGVAAITGNTVGVPFPSASFILGGAYSDKDAPSYSEIHYTFNSLLATSMTFLFGNNTTGLTRISNLMKGTKFQLEKLS